MLITSALEVLLHCVPTIAELDSRFTHHKLFVSRSTFLGVLRYSLTQKVCIC